MTKHELPDLEKSFTEISQLIEKMEHQELTLEQSLSHFERGIVLIKHCQKMLQDAEQKVQVLIQTNGQPALTSYGEEQKGRASDENQNNN